MSHVASSNHCDGPLYSHETKGLSTLQGSLPSSNRFLKSNVQVFGIDWNILSRVVGTVHDSFMLGGCFVDNMCPELAPDLVGRFWVNKLCNK